MSAPTFSAPSMTRRACLATMSAMPVAASPAVALASPRPVKAIAFDAFPIFDPRSIAAKVRKLKPEAGDALTAAWTGKLFSYTWLTTAARRYPGFEALADAALQFAAAGMNLALTGRERATLVGAYYELEPWPDVHGALERLAEAGVRLSFLSNFSEAMLSSNIERAGFGQFFETVLSTDRVRQFKPAPAAYHMAVEATGLAISEIGFAAFAGWDAVGASWFGYRTAWINRMNAPAESLNHSLPFVRPDISGALALAEVTAG